MYSAVWLEGTEHVTTTYRIELTFQHKFDVNEN